MDCKMKPINLKITSSIVNKQKHAAIIAASICLVHGHDFKFDGGRPCPVGEIDCSEPVEICKRCGVYSSIIYALHPYCRECSEISHGTFIESGDGDR